NQPTETSSTSESKSKDSASIQKGATPEQTQDPKKLAKSKEELASTKKFDMQLQSMSQKLADQLPKKGDPPKPTDISTLPGQVPGKILDQKPDVATPACTGTLLSTCGVPDTKPTVCDTLSGCTRPTTDLKTRPGPGNILDQKPDVATPACTGTLLSTCGVPDTKPEVCDTLSGCTKPSTDLRSTPRLGPGNLLEQKPSVAEPQCTGTLLSTCSLPDTTPITCPGTGPDCPS
ncbi:MAG TPA: hypothetical protein VLH08_18190, partial [Acidobacteriota bacterium]|nr:hypothetical protein [Acidobacteriota bacterium]